MRNFTRLPALNSVLIATTGILLLVFFTIPLDSIAQKSKVKFEIRIPETIKNEPVTGRMFVIISRTDAREPRFQIGRYGVPFYGVDVENLKPNAPVTIDDKVLGSPVENLGDIPPGEYFVQSMFSIYTRFERSDGHVLWMHKDQWEGQRWTVSPGNIYSDVKKVYLDPGKKQTVKLEVTNVIPPVNVPPDTKYVKRIKIQSKILTEFWGQPMYLGACILLPRGYDEHPNIQYPTIYYQGHFSLRPPFRFREGTDFYKTWTGTNFPRFIAITIQHPCPYFDDSYAVNSVNCGPFGDAIHQELIPEIERLFRCIPESYARVLTGGSTGGWESFALQCFYPDSYGGTWSFAPDPLDFHNVEGINIYEDKNAFYKIHEWRQVPTPNTRNPENGEILLTSKQRNHYELTNGTKGRSGQQLDIWSAVFGPIGEDGYFKPLFNKLTGEMNPDVAEYWKENYDLRRYLEKNWSTIGPKLVGKLHIFCGLMDNYYLNMGVHHMEEFLESTRNPYYAGTVSYGAQGSHGWRPMSSEQLVMLMAHHILRNTPPGGQKDWMYSY